MPELAVVFADSEESLLEDGAAEHAIDGDAKTAWTTSTSPDATLPHEIRIDLGAVQELTGFRYLPRSKPDDGRIELYELYASTDGR